MRTHQASGQLLDKQPTETRYIHGLTVEYKGDRMKVIQNEWGLTCVMESFTLLVERASGSATSGLQKYRTGDTVFSMPAWRQSDMGATNDSTRQWASGGSASLYLVGALHVGIFAFATGRVGPGSAPLLGFWIVGCAVALLMLAMVDLRRGEALFGTVGMVFGGLLGLGGAFSFIRSLWIPGILAIDGWWFLSAGIILFLLLPCVRKVSWIMFGGIAEIGIALSLLGLGMIGVFGAPEGPLGIAGWLALVFAIFCWYAATAQLVNTVYGKRVLPI